MKVYISADIEGVCGVVRPEHSTIQGREYPEARRLMTEEVNAAIRAAFNAGATYVLVSDSHNVGVNILPELLDHRAELITGTPRPLSMMEGIDSDTFDAALFIGYHAKPGTQDGGIVHNFHSRVRDVKINGLSVGELGFNALLAGLYNVPVIMVSGDEVTIAEAKQTLGADIHGAIVKYGIGAYSARCPHPTIARTRIYEAAYEALCKLKDNAYTSLKLAEPVVMEVEITTASGADRVMRVPTLIRKGSTTVATPPLSLIDAFRTFLTLTDLVDMVPFI